MNFDVNAILIAMIAAVLSGMGTAIIAGISDNRKEKARRREHEQDQLKLEIKDLKIELYRLEKELTEWKDKYYKAIEDLILIKSELENTLRELSEAENLDN